MQETRIAAVSMNCGLGQPQQSLDAIATWCPKAKDAGADLVLFPELIVHGHCSPNTWHVAEPVPAGPSVRRLEELAREHDLVLSVGLSEKESDIVYNAQVLVGPDGYIGKQRKIHPSRDEVLYYKGDSQVQVFDAELETNPEFMQIAAPSDTVVLIAFEVNAQHFSGLVQLCYPYFTLEPVMPYLNVQTWASRVGRKREPQEARLQQLAFGEPLFLLRTLR